MSELVVGSFDLIDVKGNPEYAPMIKQIKETLPEINKAIQNFNKTQSQFMDNTLSIAGPTPLSNVRHILAQITKNKEALAENYFKLEKKKVEIKQKQRALEKTDDELEKEMLFLEITELKYHLENAQGYVNGAIRQMTNWTEQYTSILSSLKIESFTEKDFEAEEEKYHIMTAFNQALNAARSRQGLIDEGNLIYLSQLGINCGLAQKYVLEFITAEADMINQGKIPNALVLHNFLLEMADCFKGSSKDIATIKGMTGEISPVATIGYSK